MAAQTTEKAFETYVEEILLTTGGWKSGSNAEWDKERALFPAQVFAFLQDTQSKLWAEMKALHGAGLEALLLTTLVKELDAKGSLHVLRHGFKFYGKTFRLAYFKPAHGANSEVLGAVRQEPADGDAASAVPSQRQPHAGHGAGGERTARGNH